MTRAEYLRLSPSDQWRLCRAYTVRRRHVDKRASALKDAVLVGVVEKAMRRDARR